MKIKLENIQIQQIDYRELKPLQGDLKDLTERNYLRLKKSFEEKKLFVPMFVWKSGPDFFLLDGHGRERLFKKEKAVFVGNDGKETYRVPCVVVEASNITDAKEKLLIITSQYQSITQEGLDNFTVGIDEDWVKETVHFDAFKYLDDEVGGGGGAAEDDSEAVPEPPIDPITKRGDIWVLGTHRVMCGDSVDIADIKKLLGGGKA